MDEVSGGKKLVTQVGREDHSSSWEWEDNDDYDQIVSDHDDQFKSLYAPDSYADGTTTGSGSDDDKLRKRKRKRKKDDDDDDVNPEDYPELVKFLKYDFMDEELKKRWRVIGNENAQIFQNEWIQITDRQVHLSLAKTQLIGHTYSSIMERKEEEEERRRQQQQSNPNPPS